MAIVKAAQFFVEWVSMTNHYYEGDLPADLKTGPIVAVDSETLGLKLGRDDLCVVQLSFGDGHAHIVRLTRQVYDCPNLKAILVNPEILKLFHFARFDVAMFALHLGVITEPVYCTKIASKLARTYTDRHGLKDLCRELIGKELSKAQQSSDSGAKTLSAEQIEYAASDVLYLHEIKSRLDAILIRDGRMGLAQNCFGFLGTRIALDLAGFEDCDIFAHSWS